MERERKAREEEAKRIDGAKEVQTDFDDIRSIDFHCCSFSCR